MTMDSLKASYVIFRLGEEEFGLPVDKVSGIIRYEQPTPVPRSPEAVLGVVNLRGRVVPVIDLGVRFSGRRIVPDHLTRIVVSEGKSGPVGIVVDAASEVAAFDPETIRPVPEGVLAQETARAFTGVAERREGELVILLDLEETIPSDRYASAVAGPGEGGDVDV